MEVSNGRGAGRRPNPRPDFAANSEFAKNRPFWPSFGAFRGAFRLRFQMFRGEFAARPPSTEFQTREQRMHSVEQRMIWVSRGDARCPIMLSMHEPHDDKKSPTIGLTMVECQVFLVVM